MSKRTAQTILGGLACLSAALLAIGSVCWGAQSVPRAKGARPPALTRGFGRKPVLFVPERAKTEARVRFSIRGENKTIYFAPEGLTFAMRGSAGAQDETGSGQCVVKLDFLSARKDVIPEGLESNGQSISASIIYRDLWPGIDLVYRRGPDRLDYEFIVRPGADPSRIKMAYRGTQGLALTGDNRLAIKTPAGDFEEDVPVGYQEIGGRRKGVAVTYSLGTAAGSPSPEGVSGSDEASGQGLEGPVIAVGFDVGLYERTETLVLNTAGGYFGRKTGTTSIEVTGGHAGGSKFNLPTGQWIARMGVLGYMQNSPADGTLAIYKDTATPDIKQYVCHTVTGPLPVGPANKAWTVLEVAGGPVWLDAGDYWILRNDSGYYGNKFVITGEQLDSNKWGWCFIDYPAWPQNTQYRTWVEDFSNVEGCLYAEWDQVVPDPVLTSLVPETANAGDPGFLLSVMGAEFVEGAVVRWDGADRPTTWISSSELSAQIDAGDIAVVRDVAVTVRNPEEKISNALSFTVSSPALPSITSIAPSGVTAGSPAFTLVVTGTSFVAGSVVRWDGADRPTTFISGTEISSAIGAADVAVGKSVQITVQNPSGGISNAVGFIINNPSPILSSLVPGKTTAGGPDFLLTLAGSNFVPNSVVRWNGSDRATLTVSGTELQAVVPAGDLSAAGEAHVAVFNPAPAGGLSPSLVFTVNNPRPFLTSVSPAKATAGSSAFELVLTGSSFVPGAAVLWGGSAKAAAWVSDVELRAPILAADIARGGEVQVTVSNPAPAEGISNVVVFPVATFAVSSSPASSTITAGQTASYVIQLTPQFGSFDSPVSFTCKGLPSQCTASFSPDSVTPGATGVSSTLTLATRAGANAAGMSLTEAAGPGTSAAGLVSLIAVLWLVGAGRARRRGRLIARLSGSCALLGVVLWAASCGTIGPSSNGTPKGTYRVTVEGTSGTMTLSTVITLVVK